MGKLVSVFPDLIEGKSKIHGRGVFAGRQFNSGDEIQDWTPAFLVTEDELEGGPDDDFGFQVGPTLFIQRTGKIDDFTNHSCDPSAAAIIGNGRVVLKAIRPIKPMMEVTIDYSLTMLNDPWARQCNCGTARCRKVIAEYKTLPADVRQRYEWMKIVPAYVTAPLL